MRKAINFFIAATFLAVVYFLLRSYFPKYAGFLPFFLITVLLDLYLWYSIKKAVASAKPLTRYLMTGFYWLPLTLLFLLILAGFFYPFIHWNIFLRTYLLAIVAIVYFCKLFPISFLALADLIRMPFLIRRIISEKKFQQPSDDQDEEPEDKYLNSPSGSKRISVRNILLSTGWISGTALFMLLVAGMILWNYDFRVRRQTIHLPELPGSFNGIRIVQITDTHLGTWSFPGKLKKAVSIINSLNPDIVCFTGDLVNYTSYEVYEFANILKEIKASSGIFTILGNHDYGDYVAWRTAEEKKKNRTYLQDIYQCLGWKLLLNEHVFIKRGSDSIAIIGVENWGGTRRFQRLGDLNKATKGINNASVQVLLSHDPSHWDRIVKKHYRDIDITLSGHTHGFQFGVDCCGILWSPFRFIYEKWAGMYSEPVPGSHPQYLYVNRGLGSIGYPGRVGILPEITLITLVNAYPSPSPLP